MTAKKRTAPSPMPEIRPEGIKLALDLAEALFTFASADETRVGLTGIAFAADAYGITATDGVTLAVVEQMAPCDGADPRELAGPNGRVWPRAHVDAAIRLAKARREAHVTLEWRLRALGVAAPTVACVVDGVRADLGRVKSGAEGGPQRAPAVGVNPTYLARLAKLERAVRGPGTEARGVVLSYTGEHDPIMVDFDGGMDGIRATVLISPMLI